MTAEPRTIAQRVAAERRAEFERIRQLNTPVAPGPDGEDHGIDLGPAALSRSAHLTRVDGKLRGAGQRAATPIYARMVECADLFERLNSSAQITDRQAQAGQRMLRVKNAAGLRPRVTAKVPIVHDHEHGVLEDQEVVDDACPPGFDPLTYYRHLLRKLGTAKAHLIDQACDWDPELPVGRPPTAYLATFQQALNDLADEFGLKRQGVGV